MADYQKMWKDLDMDIETHDQLCAVLPEMFGEIYLTQTNRPENMDYFNFVVAEIHGFRPMELINHQKDGGKVFGTFCIFVPEEIILAAGAIATGLCGGSQFWVPGGEKVLPASTCPLIKASVGAKLDKTCPYYQIADMFIGETTCDGKKKAWDILKESTPMHVMSLPQMKRPKDIADWADEIKILIEKVEEFTGNKITYEKLRNAIKLVNNKRKALSRLYDLRKNMDFTISGLDALLISQIAFYDDPVRFTEKLNSLCDELEQKSNQLMTSSSTQKKRIMLTGTPLAIPNWKLHHIIETAGATVVVEEMCTGTRYFEKLVDEKELTLEGQIKAIAERYMQINCACFSPNDGRIEDILRLKEEYKADAVIDVNLKFCCLYDIEGYKVEQILQKQKVPVLGIETDYSDQDVSQLKTRIEAFLEIIK